MILPDLSHLNEVSKAAFAGSYCPDDPQKLARQVDALFAAAERAEGNPAAIALIVPHAGYVYSGQVMAQADKQSEGLDYEAIVVVGVNHRDLSFR